MFIRLLTEVAIAIVLLNSCASAQATEGRQARIVQLFKAARAAEATHDLTTAIAYYDRILAIDPALAEVWVNRGLVLHELSRHKEALEAFTKASTLKPELLNAQLFLGIEYVRLGDPEKAIKPLKIVTASAPDQLQAFYELSEAYAQSGKFEAAVETNARVLRARPGLYPGLYQLGIIYLKWSKAIARGIVNSPVGSAYGNLVKAEMEEVAGLDPAAEKHYNEAVRQQPDEVVPRLALGRFYLRSASPVYVQKAGAQLELARKKEPLDPAIIAEFARLAIVQKQIPAAVESVQCIVTSDPVFGKRVISELAEEFREFSPELESGFQAKGRVLAVSNGGPSCHLTSYTKAAAQWTAAGRTRLLSVRESLLLAQSQWRLGEYAAALKALLKIPNQDPPNFAVRYWLLLTTRALARQTLQAAVDRDPGSYRAHLVLADIAKELGDMAKAEAEYQKAAETGASDPEVLLIYIQYLESIKENSRAVDRARAAVAKFPTNPKLNLELGELMLKEGDAKTAATCFRQSLAADPDLVAARTGLADSYAAIGLLDSAIAEIRPALSTDRDGSLYYRIARWYQQTGHQAEAMQAFAITKKLKDEATKRDVQKFAPGDEER